MKNFTLADQLIEVGARPRQRVEPSHHLCELHAQSVDLDQRAEIGGLRV